MLSYLSYLFRLRLLSEDCYLLEGLQTADKAKTCARAKLQNAHSLLSEMEATLVFVYFWFYILAQTFARLN